MPDDLTSAPDDSTPQATDVKETPQEGGAKTDDVTTKLEAQQQTIEELKGKIAALDVARLEEEQFGAAVEEGAKDEAPAIPDERFNDMTPAEMARSILAAADEKVQRARQDIMSEVEQKAVLNQEIARFAAAHEDFDDLRSIMWAVARERPDIEKQGLAALREEALARVRKIAGAHTPEKRDEARKVATEKPNAPSSAGTLETGGAASMDDLLLEARVEHEGNYQQE